MEIRPALRLPAFWFHLGCLLFFFAGAVFYTWPLITDLSGLTGFEGDAPMFIWDLWWFRHAVIDLHQNPFHTDYLFHPIGAELYFHTLTVARGVQYLFLSPFLDLITSHNLLYLSSYVLAGWGMVLLAGFLGISRAGAMFAGAIYSFCPYHQVRGVGHFNLTEIQWFPFFFLFFLKAMEGYRVKNALAALAFLLLIAYSDYYYFFYALLFVGWVLFFPLLKKVPLLFPRKKPSEITGDRVARWLSWAVLALLAWMFVIGPVNFYLGPVKIKIGSIGRPLLLLLICGLVRHRGEIKAFVRNKETWKTARKMGGVLAVLGGGFLVGFAPIWVGAVPYYAEFGDSLGHYKGFTIAYSANLQGYFQLYSWRAPISLPLSPSWTLSNHYLNAGIEGIIFPGYCAYLLALLGFFFWKREKYLPVFTGFGVLCFNLSLGPFLHFGDQVLWRQSPWKSLLIAERLSALPGFDSLRVPSRLSLMFTLSIALLAGWGIKNLFGYQEPGKKNPRRLAGAALGIAWVMYFLEIPPVFYYSKPLDWPVYYRAIGFDQRPVTVMDIPLNWSGGRAGYGTPHLSHHWYQTIHGKPVYSGHSSRYPLERFDRLFCLPFVGTIMKLQTDQPLEPTTLEQETAESWKFIHDHQIEYIVLHLDKDEALRKRMFLVGRYIDTIIDYELIYADEEVFVARPLGPKG